MLDGDLVRGAIDVEQGVVTLAVGGDGEEVLPIHVPLIPEVPSDDPVGFVFLLFVS